MKSQALLLAFAALAIAAIPLPAASEDRIPVVGGDGPESDACGGIGSVATYEDLLAVHSEPDEYSRQKAELPPRTLVWLCEGMEEWQGIVYPTGEFQDLGDCRVSSPVSEPRDYNGPCEHGWVLARSLQLVAG